MKLIITKPQEVAFACIKALTKSRVIKWLFPMRKREWEWRNG
jgi:hypothetical protein